MFDWYGTMVLAVTILVAGLWIAAVIMLVKSVFMGKTAGIEYSGQYYFSCVTEIVLFLILPFLWLILFGYGWMEQVTGWRYPVRQTLDLLSMFLQPISLYTLGWSTSLRKKGNTRASIIVQLSSLPVYAVILVMYYIVFGELPL